jgi:hypothetical protein
MDTKNVQDPEISPAMRNKIFPKCCPTTQLAPQSEKYFRHFKKKMPDYQAFNSLHQRTGRDSNPRPPA